MTSEVPINSLRLILTIILITETFKGIHFLVKSVRSPNFVAPLRLYSSLQFWMLKKQTFCFDSIKWSVTVFQNGLWREKYTHVTILSAYSFTKYSLAICDAQDSTVCLYVHKKRKKEILYKEAWYAYCPSFRKGFFWWF